MEIKNVEFIIISPVKAIALISRGVKVYGILNGKYFPVETIGEYFSCSKFGVK